MRLVKVLFFTLCAVIAGLVTISLFLPETTKVSRTITINRSVDDVFVMVNDFHEISKWSPWLQFSPDVNLAYSGPDSGVGAALSWDSENQQIGSGRQEIVESIANEKVRLKLFFEGQGDSVAIFQLKDVGGNTELTWLFLIDHGWDLLSRFFGLLLDGWVGGDYERGLAMLKQQLEANADSNESS